MPTVSELQQAAAHLRQHSAMAPDAVTKLEQAGDVIAKMWMDQQAQLHAVRVVATYGRNKLRQRVIDMAGQNAEVRAANKKLREDHAQLWFEAELLLSQYQQQCFEMNNLRAKASATELLISEYQQQCFEMNNLRAMVSYYQSTMSALLQNCALNYDGKSVTLNPAGSLLLAQAATQPMAQPTADSMVAGGMHQQPWE
jgi:hypothetical protein